MHLHHQILPAVEASCSYISLCRVEQAEAERHLDHPVSDQAKHRYRHHRLHTQQTEVDSLLLPQKVGIRNGLGEQREVGL
jgi:hypothetical protein